IPGNGTKAMKPKKPKASEPSLRDKLSQAFLEALEADFREYGKSVIETMRQKDPTRYAELAGKLILTAEQPPAGIDFKSARSMEEIGKKLMQSVGMDERIISPEMVQAAIEANNAFIAQLEAIRDRHEHTEGEMH